MIPPRRFVAGCRIPLGHGDCLPECRKAGACRALDLRLVDGRTFLGRPLGALGETLRFRSAWPERGPVLLPFEQVEPLSLHEALKECTDPGDGEGILRLAEVCATRGLVDLALRELDRALESSPGMEKSVRACRGRLVEDAAHRELEDAKGYIASLREDHARATLDDVLRRYPRTRAAREARSLRRQLARKTG